MISVDLFASFEWAIFPCFFLCLVILFGRCWKLYIWKNRHFSQILQTVSLDITLKWKLMTSPVFSFSVCWVFPSVCVDWPCFLPSQFPYINSSIFWTLNFPDCLYPAYSRAFCGLLYVYTRRSVQQQLSGVPPAVSDPFLWLRWAMLLLLHLRVKIGKISPNL